MMQNSGIVRQKMKFDYKMCMECMEKEIIGQCFKSLFTDNGHSRTATCCRRW
jgi:hypothetical protein